MEQEKEYLCINKINEDRDVDSEQEAFKAGRQSPVRKATLNWDFTELSDHFSSFKTLPKTYVNVLFFQPCQEMAILQSTLQTVSSNLLTF